MAGRMGIGVDLDGIDRIARETPVLIDLKPTGQGYMEDLYHAGGLVPMLREIKGLLDLDCMTVTGKTLGENLDAAPSNYKQDVIRPFDNPIYAGGAMAVLRGNLAPQGALIKQAAANQQLLQHTGRAVVFSSLADLAARIDSPDLDVKADDVIVLQNAGPKGAPGMPEAGYIPIPKKLLQQGVKDMVRISDARMSGTAFGTIVLHISPESAIGGPLGLVRNGDTIRLDTAKREISLLVDDKELEARRKALAPPPSGEGRRGYERLYFETVTQAEQGCDFSFAIPKVTKSIP
jgi:dihydroxyacid dehydratase/phosphogluconate dehydratase